MKIDEDLILPYSLAIGLMNLLFTLLITLIISCWACGFPLTWKLLAENYAVGYVVLWILNIHVVRE